MISRYIEFGKPEKRGPSPLLILISGTTLSGTSTLAEFIEEKLRFSTNNVIIEEVKFSDLYYPHKGE